MPRFDLTSLPPVDPRTRWRCPCGYEGNYHEVTGHRHGWQRRPECRGRIVKIYDPSEDAKPPSMEETPEVHEAPQPQEAQELEPPSVAETPPELSPEVIKPKIYEYVGTDEELPEQTTDDPEAIARMLTERLGLDAQRVGGNGHGELEGDFLLEPPPGPISLQKLKQIVEVPPVFLVFYDFFKSQGWFQGDGSISAWVTDFLLDHIRHCLGWRVVVVNDEEVKIVEQARSEI